MKVVTALLSDWANISNDGRINMLGAGIDRVNIAIAPSKEKPIRGQFMLVVRIERDIGEEGLHTLQVLVVEPDGNRIGDMQVQFTADKKFNNAIFGIMGIPLYQLGPHSFEVLIDGHNMISLPIDVVLTQGQAGS